MTDLSTEFYVLAVVVAFLIAVSKSGFAAGFEGLGVPLFSLFVSPIIAAGILLPILILVDCTNLWTYRKKWHWGHLKVMLPAAIIGISIGAATLFYVNTDGIKAMVGAIAVWFSTLYWLRLIVKRAAVRPMRPLSGAFMSMVSGFTSHVAHAGAPPVRAYLLSQNLDKSTFMGTVGVYFYVVNLIKLGPCLLFGTLTVETFKLSLSLLPAVALGVLLGVTLHKRVSQVMFTRIAYGFLFLAGLKLV